MAESLAGAVEVMKMDEMTVEKKFNLITRNLQVTQIIFSLILLVSIF